MRACGSLVRFILVAHFSIKTVSLICLVASTLAKAVLATPHIIATYCVTPNAHFGNDRMASNFVLRIKVGRVSTQAVAGSQLPVAMWGLAMEPLAIVISQIRCVSRLELYVHIK